MSNTIDQYREAKATYQKLHSQAKRELVARFNQLAAELLQIQRELKEDFGHNSDQGEERASGQNRAFQSA